MCYYSSAATPPSSSSCSSNLDSPRSAPGLYKALSLSLSPPPSNPQFVEGVYTSTEAEGEKGEGVCGGEERRWKKGERTITGSVRREIERVICWLWWYLGWKKDSMLLPPPPPPPPPPLPILSLSRPCRHLSISWR